MNCPALITNGTLTCLRTDPHEVGHVFHASESPDRHTEEASP